MDEYTIATNLSISPFFGNKILVSGTSMSAYVNVTHPCHRSRSTNTTRMNRPREIYNYAVYFHRKKKKKKRTNI